jgi:hypothetical protein
MTYKPTDVECFTMFLRLFRPVSAKQGTAYIFSCLYCHYDKGAATLRTGGAEAHQYLTPQCLHLYGVKYN